MEENKVHQISERMLIALLKHAFISGQMCQLLEMDEKKQIETVIKYSKSLI